MILKKFTNLYFYYYIQREMLEIGIHWAEMKLLWLDKGCIIYEIKWSDKKILGMQILGQYCGGL